MPTETPLFCPECGVRLYVRIRAEIVGEAEITHLYADSDTPTPDPGGPRTIAYDPKSVDLWCRSCGPVAVIRVWDDDGTAWTYLARVEVE